LALHDALPILPLAKSLAAGSDIHYHIPDHPLQRTDKFCLCMRIVLVMQTSQHIDSRPCLVILYKIYISACCFLECLLIKAFIEVSSIVIEDTRFYNEKTFYGSFYDIHVTGKIED